MRSVAMLVALLLFTGCVAPLTERLRAVDVEEPRWNVGDWWTYNVTSDLIGASGDITVVVAEIVGDGYILGIPAQTREGENAAAALLYHMPAIGPVHRDLSWDVHETRFEPAKWPLKDDLAWETTWISQSVHLTARQNGTRWTINNSGFEIDDGMRYELVYDPAVKWFTSFTRTGLDGVVRQSMTLVANGTGYNGTLRAPQFIEVAFLESRTQGVMSGGLPAAPNPSFTPSPSATNLLVGCLAGGAPGQYRAELLSPAGGICALDVTVPPGDTGVRAQVLEVDASEGQWQARLAAIGQGSATVEVLAWPELNYTLGG
ncbi:MAG TPA: hypothetical protein VFH78_02600 [Candidatus Thermoplasmatota archaeon]|nr:hypothetical protein [Candidatus Thermoplasmatota archaeon]